MKSMEQFIMKTMHYCIYSRKIDTTSSFYHKEGSKILPNRLSITNGEVNDVARKGRNAGKEVTGQILGQFKRDEESPFKQFKPYTIRTQLWQHPDFPSLEYGTLGISNVEGKITRESDKGDLIVIYRNNTDEIEMWIFPSMGKNPDNFMAAMKYVSKIKRGI